MLYKLKIIFYHIEVAYTNLLYKLFNFEKSTSPIPKNTPYCYVIDHERNKKEPITDTYGYWTKPCKYYRNMKGHNAACTYVGFIGFDPCLGDQCKICGISNDFE